MEKHHKKEHEKKEEHKTGHGKEHVEHTPETKKYGLKMNVWMVATIVLAIAFLVALFTRPSVGNVSSVGANECATKIIAYLNDNLVQPGTSAALATVKEKSGVYEIVTLYQGRNISVYSSPDCQILFLSALNTSEKLPTAREETETQGEPVKSDKPVVELYVMSFCPYGVQAENLMKPVVDLLGSVADIKVRFIANVGGNTVESVNSLHGIEEAKEDLRQLCIMKYYPSKYWSYLMDINTNCYPIYRDSAKMDSCWKNASSKLGIDTSKIETCAYGSEGLALLSADETLTDQYGISGSPTLLINGQRYSGSRSSEAFKQAICNAFNTPPSQCSQNVSSSAASTTPSGSCS